MDVIKTSDFTLASTLLTLGFDIIGIDKTNPRRVVFYYRRTSEVEVALKKYDNNEIVVNPKQFVFSQREIRGRIHTDYE